MCGTVCSPAYKILIRQSNKITARNVLKIAMHDIMVVKILDTFQYGSTIEASVLCTVPTHDTKKVYGSPYVDRR